MNDCYPLICQKIQICLHYKMIVNAMMPTLLNDSSKMSELKNAKKAAKILAI